MNFHFHKGFHECPLKCGFVHNDKWIAECSCKAAIFSRYLWVLKLKIWWHKFDGHPWDLDDHGGFV